MNSRALILGIQLLSIAGACLALGTSIGCPFVRDCDEDTGWQEARSITLGVDSDLEAVIRLNEREGDRYWTNLAVGAGGTVVTWGETIGETIEPFVERFLVGGSVLHDVEVNEAGWWVVGAAGTLAVSQSRGQMWSLIDLGIDADYHAISSHVDKLVIVGDDIVVVRDPSGNWVEIVAPNNASGSPGGSGWGQLRGLHGDGTRMYAVGLAGVVWSCTDPLGDWTAEPIGVDVDLFGVCGHESITQQVMVVGAQGTMILGDSDAGWARVESSTNVDFIDCSESTVLAADGVVSELRSEADLVAVGTIPGALALRNEPNADLVAVGEAGVAVRVDAYECAGH